jgi:hypothetical protein
MKKLIFLLLMVYRSAFAQEQSEAGGMQLFKYGTGPNALISFHGKNGKYNDSATIVYDTERGVGVDLTVFTLYALQLNSGDVDWSKNDIWAAFEAVMEDGFTSVDITGLSLGGMAVIRAMRYNDDPEYEGKWPRLQIKSCGIVCGKDDQKRYASFAKVPIKAWHDPTDPTMPYNGIKMLVDSAKAYGGEAELITLQGVSHNAWNVAYNRDAENNYYEWLDSFYHEQPEPPEPTSDPVKTFVVVDEAIGVITTASGKTYEIEVYPVSSGGYGYDPRHRRHGRTHQRQQWSVNIFSIEIRPFKHKRK